LALDRGEWLASCPNLLTLVKGLWYSLDRRLDGPQSQSGHSGEKIFLPCPCPELNPVHLVCSLVTKLTELIFFWEVNSISILNY